jgi:hypothetical protein
MTPAQLARIPKPVRDLMYRMDVEDVREDRFATVKEESTSWASAYAGKPIEFIGEVMGSAWWTDDWLPWRVFVRSLFGVPIIDEREITVFRECTGLDNQPEGVQRECWLPVGRRGGKSRVLALIAVYLAACFDWTPYFAPGERGFISVLAAYREQAQTILGYVVAAFLDHKNLSKLLVKPPSAEAVELVGRVVIRVATASFRAVRSPTTIAALCDEIAFWRTEDSSANPDREILEAIKPSMLTIPGSMLLGASSPYARRGVLWDAYDQHYGIKHRAGAPLVWKAPTWVMHPGVNRAEIDKKYDEDPNAADAEYGAEFRRDVAAFVDTDAVKALVVRDLFEIFPIAGVSYRAFVDPSGGSSDSMTLAVAHLEKGRGILDCVREVVPPFSPESTVVEFVRVLRSYRVTRVKGDHYGGDWPAERFREKGIGYEVSDLNKSEIYGEFLPLVNAARVQYLDVPRLVNQTCALERRTARGGRDSIDHPPGAHDDLVNVAAGVLVDVVGRKPMAISPSVIARARSPEAFRVGLGR